MTKAQDKAAAVRANKWAAWQRKVTTLLGHISHRALNREHMGRAFETGQSADSYAAEIASLEPVGRAVHAVKAEAIAFAAEEAREAVAKVRDDLITHGWDRNAAAPYPLRTVASWERERAVGKYQLYCQLTKADPAHGYQSSRGPQLVIMNDEAIARFVQEAKRAAAAQYDAFIVKLVAKVGEATDATLQGSHVWGSSTLTVTKPDGTAERWHTQQIVNYSVLGNAYLQWPTRKLKGPGK